MVLMPHQIAGYFARYHFEFNYFFKSLIRHIIIYIK